MVKFVGPKISQARGMPEYLVRFDQLVIKVICVIWIELTSVVVVTHYVEDKSEDYPGGWRRRKIDSVLTRVYE